MIKSKKGEVEENITGCILKGFLGYIGYTTVFSRSCIIARGSGRNSRRSKIPEGKV